MFPSQFANIVLTYQTLVTNLHFLKVELRCKLRGKLHRVTGPLGSGQKKIRDGKSWRELVVTNCNRGHFKLHTQKETIEGFEYMFSFQLNTWCVGKNLVQRLTKIGWLPTLILDWPSLNSKICSNKKWTTTRAFVIPIAPMFSLYEVVPAPLPNAPANMQQNPSIKIPRLTACCGTGGAPARRAHA